MDVETEARDYAATTRAERERQLDLDQGLGTYRRRLQQRQDERIEELQNRVEELRKSVEEVKAWKHDKEVETPQGRKRKK